MIFIPSLKQAQKGGAEERGIFGTEDLRLAIIAMHQMHDDGFVIGIFHVVRHIGGQEDDISLRKGHAPSFYIKFPFSAQAKGERGIGARLHGKRAVFVAKPKDRKNLK